ncbi:MAG: hypothetical protein U0791_13315 [Gemmataceae bacterium]
MRRAIITLLLLALSPAVANAQPAFFEPPAGFYKARGPAVKAAWSVDRTSLRENETLTATLTIRGATNPADVVRPNLAKIRAFADRFQIEDVPGESPIFVYKLRPRNAQVNRLPSLDFFYDSGVKVGDPFKNARATGIDLTVIPAEKPASQPTPLIAPERLFRLETGPQVLERSPFAAGWLHWLGMFLLGVLAAGGWYAAWRRIYPDGARLAKLRRNRAMRRATDALARAGSAADVAAAVIGYVRSRCPLPAGCETPSETDAALRSAGIPGAESAEALLRRCDAARFSPSSDNAVSLAAEARELLATLEAAG